MTVCVVDENRFATPPRAAVAVIVRLACFIPVLVIGIGIPSLKRAASLILLLLYQVILRIVGQYPPLLEVAVRLALDNLREIPPGIVLFVIFAAHPSVTPIL